jgi:xanthine dehydrogenase accessory factor
MPAGVPPWLAAALELERHGSAFAVVARIGAGDAAAPALVVALEGTQGTLGDPALDPAAAELARQRLAGPGDERSAAGAVVDLPEGPLVVHLVVPRPFRIVLFGNGHVGRALARILAALPVEVRWVDAREEDFPAGVAANVEVVADDDPLGEVARAPAGACIVVMTHSHPLDFDIAAAALARDDLAYVGMIGSKAKRRQFEARLAGRGLDSQRIQRLVCPIGAGMLAGKEPGVIALAVAAELLRVRERMVDGAKEPAAPVRTATERG